MNIYLIRRRDEFVKKEAIPSWIRFARDYIRNNSEEVRQFVDCVAIPDTNGRIYAYYGIKNAVYFMMGQSFMQAFDCLFTASSQLDIYLCNENSN